MVGMTTTEKQFSGSALRRVRRRVHLTQAQLAEKARCSRNIVSRAEAEDKCSSRMARRFADALAVSGDSFYEQIDVIDDRLTRQEKRVLEIMRTHPEAADFVLSFALGFELSPRRD